MKLKQKLNEIPGFGTRNLQMFPKAHYSPTASFFQPHTDYRLAEYDCDVWDQPGCPSPWRGPRGRCPDCTSESHPGFIALAQAAGRAVFPSELVDGAVVPAGTEVFLFTCKHQRKRQVGGGYLSERCKRGSQPQQGLQHRERRGAAVSALASQFSPPKIYMFWENSTALSLLLQGWLFARHTGFVPEPAAQSAAPIVPQQPSLLPTLCTHSQRLANQDLQGESLCSPAEAVNKQQLKSNEIRMVWFSVFKCHTSVSWLFAVTRHFSPRRPSKHSLTLLPQH